MAITKTTKEKTTQKKERKPYGTGKYATANANAKANSNDPAPVKAPKISNFRREVLARLEGDDNEKLAIRAERLATSAITAQLAALEGSLTMKEMKVDEANEALQTVLFPTNLKVLEDGDAFCKAIVAAKDKVRAAEDVLEQTKNFIADLREVLEQYA